MKFERLPFKWGDPVRDKISGFTGTLTAVGHYITGCTQVCLTPRVDKDGKMQESQWFDVDRIELADSPDLLNAKIEVKTAGGPNGPGAAAPTR